MYNRNKYFEEKRQIQKERILKILQEKDKASREEIKQSLGYYTTYLDETLRLLRDEGKIKKEGQIWKLIK